MGIRDVKPFITANYARNLTSDAVQDVTESVFSEILDCISSCAQLGNEYHECHYTFSSIGDMDSIVSELGRRRFTVLKMGNGIRISWA